MPGEYSTPERILQLKFLACSAPWLRLCLTLPGIHAQGFLVQRGDLLVARLGVRVEAISPQAFSGEPDVSLCPRVHAKAFARMLSAALWSLSKTTPQLGQMWVRTLSDFFTIALQALHSWLVKCGATAMTGTLCMSP